MLLVVLLLLLVFVLLCLFIVFVLFVCFLSCFSLGLLVSCVIVLSVFWWEEGHLGAMTCST